MDRSLRTVCCRDPHEGGSGGFELTSLAVWWALQEGSDAAAGALVGAFAGVMILVQLVSVVLAIVTAIGMWKVFEKAGQPGWGCLIPFYNVFLLLQMVNKPAWWLVLFFVPLVNLVIAIILSVELASAFGKGGGFGVGLAFLPAIFYPLLGFGDAQYQGMRV
jgi:hypothetical protein